MPPTRLVLYRESDGNVPLLDWFDELVPKARAKCRVRLERLAELGHELRRPEADLLRDGIHELRVKHAGVNYRMLYFFYGTQAVVVSHGFFKQEARVPAREIELALRRKNAFEATPAQHTATEGT
jgi:phage-related protein